MMGSAEDMGFGSDEGSEEGSSVRVMSVLVLVPDGQDIVVGNSLLSVVGVSLISLEVGVSVGV